MVDSTAASPTADELAQAQQHRRVQSMNTRRVLQTTATAFGALLLAAAGAAAASADEQHGESGVDVTVEIDEIDEPGILALSVAGTEAVLAEDGSTALVRQFTGDLPVVTVTDTRDPDDVPDGVAWFVLGTASDFEGGAGQPAIPAENFGWVPALVGDDSEGLVFAGEAVDGALGEDGGPGGGAGLSDTELLVSTIDSGAVATGASSWSATAELLLRTPADVAPGDYASTLTLSLFE